MIGEHTCLFCQGCSFELLSALLVCDCCFNARGFFLFVLICGFFFFFLCCRNCTHDGKDYQSFQKQVLSEISLQCRSGTFPLVGEWHWRGRRYPNSSFLWTFWRLQLLGEALICTRQQHSILSFILVLFSVSSPLLFPLPLTSCF